MQSPWLKKALGEILKDYPGVACEMRRLEFDAPFKPFVHRWTEFIKYMEKCDIEATTKKHMQVLHGVLVQEIGEKIKDFEDYVMNGVITFDCLWMIFQPSTVVISEHTGAISAFELVEANYGESLNNGKTLDLELTEVEWDGKAFGRCRDQTSVPCFTGTRRITSLRAFPLEFHEDREELENQLITRGRKFEALAGNHYKA